MRWGAVVLGHGLVLSALASVGGGAGGPVLVGALVVGQILESSVAVDRPDTADASALVIGMALLGVIGAALLWPGEARTWGGAVIALGVGLRVWAIRTLGPLFLDGVARRAVHPWVQAGPYRLARHPAALGTFLIALGACLTTGSSPAWAGLVFGMAPALLWRVGAEDALWEGRRAQRRADVTLVSAGSDAGGPAGRAGATVHPSTT